jgi:hypothetical protein
MLRASNDLEIVIRAAIDAVGLADMSERMRPRISRVGPSGGKSANVSKTAHTRVASWIRGALLK